MANWYLKDGDCVAGMASIGDLSVDHVITDPPYSKHVHSNVISNAKAADGGSFSKDGPAKKTPLPFGHLKPSVRRACAEHFARVCRRWCLVFCEVEGAHRWKRDLEQAGMRVVRIGAWVRKGSMPQVTGDRPGVGFEAIVIAHSAVRGPEGRYLEPMRWNGGGRAGVWEAAIAQAGRGGPERVHPTQKPEPLLEALVRDFTDRGDLILDPFAGSGTHGVAALRQGRRFVGWEKDPVYHQAASTRLANTREQLGLFGGTNDVTT